MSKKETWEKHPSFGLVSIARAHGSRRLFESPFEHQNFIILSVSKAARKRTDLHDTMVMPEGEIVEISLSETQFARMITSLNLGFGVPCTISRLDGKLVNEPPTDQTKQTFEKEGREHFADLLAMAEELSALTEKKPAEIKAPERERMKFLALKLTQGLSSSIEFFHKQFQETMDKVTAVAKAEIDAHMHQVVQKAGLQAIAAKDIPIRLLMDKKEAP